MYARYIPPPKGAKPSPALPQVEAPPPVAASPSQAISSATPYSRYVPPARFSQRPADTPTPASRAPPTSKTHINAAAIPPPESLPAKIVFNYDDEDPSPSPSKKRKIDASESVSVPSSKEEDENLETPKKSKKVKKEQKDKDMSGEEKKKKKEKRSKDEKGDIVEENQKKKKKTKKEKKKKDESQPFVFGFDEGADPPDAHESRIQALQADKTKNERNKDAQPRDSQSKKEKRSESNDETSARHKSVLEKAAKSIKEGLQKKTEDSTAVEEDGAEPVEAHGLEPLPQPEPVNLDSSIPTFETLPAWIANPIRVSPETKASFTDLGISKETATKLGTKGYQNAFAVQTAVIPLLLPHPDRKGDVVVSAATGSGKTLAYVLPMISDISHGVVTRLRGVIVVPTRELVLQAKEVCEACATALSGPGKKTVKIGISMGNKQFEQEQADLVEEEQRYDPEGHEKWLQEHFEQDLETSLFDESPKPLPDHVVDYNSKVDILICTPGRLVDHIHRTKGFTMDYVRWLVVDEADKLLAQTFQDWLPVVMPKLNTTTKPGARDFSESNKSGVQKVILSATMTRDISLLNGLKLFRPKLITLEGVSEEDGKAQESKTEHVLPELLEESAIKIRDPNLKPLYLIDLLNGGQMKPMNGTDEDVEMKDASDKDTSSSESESDSGSGSDSSDSDVSSSDESESESEDSDVSTNSPLEKRKSSASRAKSTIFRNTVLIFTKSNETAIRLSRLLSLLSPKFSPLIGTLTSTTRTSRRRKTLRAFAAGKLRILVASDLVARGIDLTNLDHVVNYDMPTSVASYVHRVGRTARAGRKGHAWTLFTKTEAGWFWTAIAGKGESKSQGAAGAGDIKRRGKVGEIRVDDRWEETKVAEFEAALEKLGKEASEMRRKR